MKRTILIVEDENIVAMELDERLQEMGYRVTDICATGKTAVEKAKKNKPDIILMDIILKGEQDGIETAAAIRENLDIPVIFLTSHSDKKTLNRALKESPYGYILKPFREKELQITIKLALERHTMEEKVRESETWLQTTLNSIEDGVITTDRNGIIKFINPAAVMYTGVVKSEAIGKDFECIVKIKKKKTQENISSFFEESEEREKRKNHHEQIVLFSQENNEYEIEYSTSPIKNKKKDVLGFVFVFHDVTERNKMKEKIAHTQKLESLGVISGGIAHNFNNLLMGIFGNISLAKLYSSPDDKCNTFLKDAEKILNETQNLSKKLLTFSRGGPTASTKLNTADVIRTSSLAVLEKTQVQLVFSTEPELLPIRFDETQFRQIVSNIVENAVHAMNGEGLLQIRCNNVRIEKNNLHYKEGTYVKVEIEDTGSGIKQEILNNIFDPFFTTEENRNGIGLSTAYFILRNHHAYISADSEPGQGTTFTLFLPVSSLKDKKQKKAPSMPKAENI